MGHEQSSGAVGQGLIVRQLRPQLGKVIRSDNKHGITWDAWAMASQDAQ